MSANGPWATTTSDQVNEASEENVIARLDLFFVLWAKGSVSDAASHERQKRQVLMARKHRRAILVAHMGPEEAPLPPWLKGATVVPVEDMGGVLLLKMRVQRGEISGTVLPPWPYPVEQLGQRCPMCDGPARVEDGSLVHAEGVADSTASCSRVVAVQGVSP